MTMSSFQIKMCRFKNVEGHAMSEAEPRADTDAEPKRGVEANAEQRARRPQQREEQNRDESR